MDARAMPEVVPEDSEPPGTQSEQTETRLRAHVETLEQRLRKRDDQRRALLHIMADLNEANRRLADQRRRKRAPTRRELRQAMEQVRKATKIIPHLRICGRAAPASREPIALRAVIERALSLVQEQLRLHQIEVTLDLGPQELVIVGNAIQLEQVFINLLTNARDALVEAPRKAIRISASLGRDAVEIAFADSGHGIPSALERRIFDPFFTTKEVGKGTGLGLSITYGIVKDHGGTISVQSSPGEGATFLIHLPLASAHVSELSAP